MKKSTDKGIMILSFIMMSTMCYSQQKFTDSGYAIVLHLMNKAFFIGVEPVIDFHEAYYTLDDSITASNHKQLYPYKMFIKRAFENLMFQELSSKNYIPTYIKYKGKPCVIFNGIVYNKVVNSYVNNDSESRAKLIFDKLGKNLFQQIPSKKWDDNAPYYVGIQISYFVQDFSNNYEIRKNEDVLFIAPINTIKSFAKLNISSENFSKSVELYVKAFSEDLKFVK